MTEQEKILVWAIIVVLTMIAGGILWRFLEYVGEACFPGGNAMTEGESIFECNRD